MRLYEIDNAIADVIERGYSFDEETGEIFFDAADLEQLQADRTEKLEGCAVIIKSLDAEAAAMIEEEKALKARRQAVERKRARLREYVASSMLAAGEAKIETPRAALSFRKSTSVEVPDVDALPPAYVVDQVTRKADKTALKKALQAGEEVAGAQLVTKENLQVK